MILAYAFCNVSVMPVRSEPSHRAEQTTQLLFGEKAEIMEINRADWAKIRSTYDDYEGWCKASQLTIIQKKAYKKETKYLSANDKGKLVMKTGEMWLPMGSDLTGLKGGSITPVHLAGTFKGKKLNVKEASLNCEAIRNAAMPYLHAPFLWGGRSVAGLDCSGLTQMAFKLCNYPLPRDSSQQALKGELVDFLQHAQCGDLAFFDEKDGRITHVGILLDSQTIIHATETTGRVLIDRIDQEGIISTILKKRTHHLRVVKRFITA